MVKMCIVGIDRLPAYVTHLFTAATRHFVTAIFLYKLSFTVITCSTKKETDKNTIKNIYQIIMIKQKLKTKQICW